VVEVEAQRQLELQYRLKVGMAVAELLHPLAEQAFYMLAGVEGRVLLILLVREPLAGVMARVPEVATQCRGVTQQQILVAAAVAGQVMLQ
jgi:hypothetical protein